MDKCYLQEGRISRNFGEVVKYKVVGMAKKVLIGAGAIAISVVLAFAGIGAYKVFANKSTNTTPALQEEHHNITIDRKIVRNSLSECEEMMTYRYDYSGEDFIEDYRTFTSKEIKIPFTKHKIDMTYKGYIKAGYNIDDIEIDVDDFFKKIYITLPLEPIYENNLPEEDVTSIDDNNHLNMIRSDEVTLRLADIKAEELEKAIELGLNDKAEENAKKVITKALAEFDGYEVIFR